MGDKLAFAAGGVICEGASMFPTSYLHGCSLNSNSFSKRAMQNLNWEKCVSRAVPNWDKMMFFFCQESCWRTIHYHWNLVIYLCYIIRIIVVLYYIIITPLPTYLLPYLIHMKAGPRHQTSHYSNCLILIQSCRRFSEVKHCAGPYLWTLPASRNSAETNGSLSLEQVRLKMWCIWSKYEQYGRMSASGTSCSKETELRIRFMNHHRDCWARCNMY